MTVWDEHLDLVAEALVTDGLIVLDSIFPDALVERLRRQVGMLNTDRALRPAGIGRGEAHRQSESIRTDEILWLSSDDAAEAEYLDVMERLRLGLNRRLFLGIFDYECHFAVYAPGAFYRRHLDAFQGQRNRIVTTVFYLNSDWSESDGGELLVYADEADTETDPLHVLQPMAGRLVVFLSDRFPHEVLPARRQRYSIAGWFRLNDSDSRRVDPSR